MTRDDDGYRWWERNDSGQAEEPMSLEAELDFLRRQAVYLQGKIDSLEGVERRVYEDAVLMDAFRSFLCPGWTLKSLLKDVEDFVRSRPFYQSKCEKTNAEKTGGNFR